MIKLRTAWRLATSRRFHLLFIIPNVAFLVIAWLTTATTLIPILNLVVLALGSGVCVAYLSSSIEAILADRRLDKADLLVIGIFTSWFSMILRTGWSVVWRWAGMPMALVNTDFTSYFIFMVAAAGIYHLVAPGALKEQVPPRRWIAIGGLVAGGVMLAMALLYAADARVLLKMVAGAHDLDGAPTPASKPIGAP